MPYTYSSAAAVLDIETPLVTRADLLLVCKEIDETTPEDETTAFIADAHTLVATLIDGYGIPTALLTLIEKNLAAHFAAQAYPTIQREGLGPMSRSFAVKAGAKGLEVTRYGQTAVSLDPTGTLARYSEGKGQRTPIMRSVGSGILPAEY